MNDPFREEKSARDKLGHLAELALANQPGTTDVRIETCGSDPKASVTISASMLRILLFSYDIATGPGGVKWRGAA